MVVKIVFFNRKDSRKKRNWHFPPDNDPYSEADVQTEKEHERKRIGYTRGLVERMSHTFHPLRDRRSIVQFEEETKKHLRSCQTRKKVHAQRNSASRSLRKKRFKRWKEILAAWHVDIKVLISFRHDNSMSFPKKTTLACCTSLLFASNGSLQTMEVCRV